MEVKILHISKLKFIILGSIAVLVVVMLMALVVPAIASSPKEGNRGTQGTPPNQNGTVTQGNTTASVTGTAANDNVMVRQGNTRGPMNGASLDRNGTMVEGTATGTVTVTPTDGTAVTLTCLQMK
jgi:hypothetical protein